MNREWQEFNELTEDIRADRGRKWVPEGKTDLSIPDPQMRGLFIRVYNSGEGSWIIRYKLFGRSKKFVIGDVKLVGRAKAIKIAKKILSRIELERADPIAAKKERMRANKVTFATQAPLFLEDNKKQGLRPRTILNRQIYLITGYHFKPLHNLPLDEVTSEQVQTQLDVIAAQSGGPSAWLCYGVLNVFFKWAITTKKLPPGHPNPMASVEAPPKGETRERVWDDDEIRVLWNACDMMEAEIKERNLRTPRDEVANIAVPRTLKLALVTGMRRQEIAELRWADVDIDNKELKIPRDRIKNEEDLHIPLADLAVEIICSNEKKDEFVFPANDGGQGSHNLGHITEQINARIIKAGGVPPKDWTIHDARRTVRTRLAALGVGMEVGEALLNHVSHRSPIERVYNRYDYWAEKRKAVIMWEDNLRAVIDGTAPKIERSRWGERRQQQ